MMAPIVVADEFWVLASGHGKTSPTVFITSQPDPQGQCELASRAFEALQFKTQQAAERRLAEFAREPLESIEPELHGPMHIPTEALMTDASGSERA